MLAVSKFYCDTSIQSRLDPMKNILIPIDGSEPSLRALEFGAQLAEGLGTKLTLLVVHQHIVGRKAVVSVWTAEEVSNILKKAKELAMGFYRKDIAIAEVKSRDVARAVMDYAEQNEIDLIVMGASGMGSVKAFLIGSVSEEVLRKSICPVTIVH